MAPSTHTTLAGQEPLQPMTKEAAPTLSTHLLAEAAKFFIYPTRTYRTKTNIAVQQLLDSSLGRLLEWRKTFAPSKDNAAAKWLFETPGALDQVYSRELLRAVPGIVQRTQSLADLTLSRGSVESFVYLREASNCFILGLPQAAVALARAAVEVPLRQVTSKQFGEKAVDGLGLFELLKLANRGRLLSREAMASAHTVRVAADKVLHEGPTTTSEALEVLEAARPVVAAVTSKAG